MNFSTFTFIWSRTFRVASSISSSVPVKLAGFGNDQFNHDITPGNTGHFSALAASQTATT